MIRKEFTEYASEMIGKCVVIPMNAYDFIVFIPENDFGIQEGYYEANDIAMLLRTHRYDPDAIHFIADMLEV